MINEYSQDSRQLRISTPFGSDTLLISAFSGSAGISRMFEYEVALFSPKADLDPTEIVGQVVDVSIRMTQTDVPIFYNAHVIRFIAAEFDVRGDRIYRATLAPWLWFLTRAANCRIFQEMSVKEIIEAVLTEHSTDFVSRLTGTYPPRDYCVQYNETDFAFVSRLMEEVGIAYWFEHEDGQHMLVLADNRAAVVDCIENEVDYSTGSHVTSHISRWEHQYEFRSGKWTHNDYFFMAPTASRIKSEPTIVSLPGNSDYEIYEYGDGYTWSKESLESDPKKTQVRMQADEGAYDIAEGDSSCASFAPGFQFKLNDHAAAAEKNEYLLTSVNVSASEGAAIVGRSGGFEYSNSFRCIPASVLYRPQRVTPRPRMRGIQTATVVGPSGEEIYTDKYGRVKTQFHWDREGASDENSSCWIRVAQSSAGKNWGIAFHPRIGQEVVVSFLEGDPDRPLITGVVYNADHMPPYELPANQNKSVVKSHSTLKGDAATFNELYFDDTKGDEEIYFHAEKDFNRVVENDDTLKVGFQDQADGDQSIEIFNNQDIEIGCVDAADGSQTVKIFNNQDIEVGCDDSPDGSQTVGIQTDRTVQIKTGDDTLTVDKGDRKVTIKTGSQDLVVNKDESITIKTGNRAIDVSAGKSTHKAAMLIQLKCGLSMIEMKPSQILFKCGPSKVKIDPSGVAVEGIMVKMKGVAMFDAKAPIAKVSGDGLLMLKGGIAMIN